MSATRLAFLLLFTIPFTGFVDASPSFAERVVVSEDDAEYEPKIQLDGAGLPRLAYLAPGGVLTWCAYTLSGTFTGIPLSAGPYVAHDYKHDRDGGEHIIGAATGAEDVLRLRYFYRPPTGGAFTSEIVLDVTRSAGITRFSMKNSLSMAVSDDGVVHVVYMLLSEDAMSVTFNYARRSVAGVWTIETIGNKFSIGVAAAVDEAGVPWILSYRVNIFDPSAPWEIVLANRSGGSWSSEIITTFIFGEDLPALSGAFFALTGAIRPAIGFTGDGSLHIAYTNGSLKYAVRAPGGEFQTETVRDFLKRLGDAGLSPTGSVLTGLGVRIAISPSGDNPVNLVFETFLHEDLAEDPDDPDELRVLDRALILAPGTAPRMVRRGGWRRRAGSERCSPWRARRRAAGSSKITMPAGRSGSSWGTGPPSRRITWDASSLPTEDRAGRRGGSSATAGDIPPTI